MRYNTRNPVEPNGSSDPRDLFDNAANLDLAVNGPAPAWVDRTGVSRKSWAGMEADFLEFLENSGFELPPLVYVDGSPLTVDRPTQLIDRGGVLYGVKLPASFPVVLTGTWATDEPLLVARNDEALRGELEAPNGGIHVGYRNRDVDGRLADNLHVKDHPYTGNGIANDTPALQAAINESGQSGREVNLGGGTFYAGSALTNTYGAPMRDGKVLIPSLISGQKTQLNTYADDVNGVMIGRENLYAFRLACANGATQTNYIYGDSTVITGGAYLVKPHDLIKFACWSKGVTLPAPTNRGVSGTSWSDLNALPDLSANTKLIVIKYGINDALKTNALATIAADARAKLAAIRAAANGGPDNLSILLMGPNSTYYPTIGQDAKWYEGLRNLYLQLCKEFDCAYFDTYAYMQQTRNAPGTWMDETSAGSGEGIHPMPLAIYWFWWEAFGTYILEDGNWNATKSNHFWNIGLVAGGVSTTTNPQDFPKGKSLWIALTANGWPMDGMIEVTRHDGGITEMRLCGQQVVPRTMVRRGAGTTWTQWTDDPTAITSFLNSWANKGGGYNSAGFVVHDDGWVELYGTLTGGTLGSSAFLLPTTARPGAAHLFLTAGGTGSGTAATVTVFADGNVVPSAASNATVSLDGIRFRFGA